MKSRIGIPCVLGAMLALGAPIGHAQGTAPLSGASLRPLLDYHGRGTVQVTIPETSVSIGFEQSYVAPDALLFSFDMPPLKQYYLVNGSTERSYSPAAGYLVERRYRNLEKLPFSPSVAVQMSMAQFGRVIRELKTVQELGTEPLLGQECRLIRFGNRELTDNLLAKGIIGEAGAATMNKGTTRAWLTQAHGLPVKIQIYSNEGAPAVLLSFSELKINGGLKASDLRLPLLPNTALIPVTVDVAAPNWEENAEKEVQKQLIALKAAQSKRKQ